MVPRAASYALTVTSRAEALPQKLDHGSALKLILDHAGQSFAPFLANRECYLLNECAKLTIGHYNGQVSDVMSPNGAA
jgi:hypothetical protein